MAWPVRYETALLDRVQEPIYAVIVLRDRTMLTADITASSTTINGDTADEMTLPYNPSLDDFIVYGDSGFELMRGTYDVANNRATGVSRGTYGTVAAPFTRGDIFGALWMGFSTEAIPGGYPFRGGMGFPSGGQLELDIREGHTRSGGVDFDVLDGDDAGLTRQLRGTSIVGKWAIVLGGYRGWTLKDMAFLHVGPVTGFSLERGVYSISVDTILVKMKRRLFGDVEAFKTTLSGSMNSSQGTIPLADVSGLYDSVPTMLRPDPATGGSAATDYRAAMYLKVGDEYMRHEGGTSPVDVTRGCFGSTAASHSSGASVDYLFAVDANPIDFLVGLLLTRDPNFEPLVLDAPYTGAWYYDWWETVDLTLAKGPLGMNIDPGDVDLSTFLVNCRDQYFADTFGRFCFPSAIDTESFLRESILKPLNAFIYPTRTGRLAMGIVRPPVEANPWELTRDDIVGTPRLEFTSDDIMNEVSVSFDYDPISKDPDRETRVLDAPSQSTYDRVGTEELEPTWLTSSRNGDVLSARLARKKMRHLREPNPTIPLEVAYANAGIELGSVGRVRYPGLADPIRGKVDWDRYCLVVGRKVDWQRGTLRFDVMDTAYVNRRWALIGPSGQADYDVVSDQDRATYGFLAATAAGFEDGTGPYTIL